VSDPRDPLTEGAARLAEDAERLLSQHERDDHDGHMCLVERAGMVAFFAHRLGVNTEAALELFVDCLAEYERAHVERNGHGHA
jgi:hypothetical protein